MNTRHPPTRTPANRAAFTLTELLVAATLLVTILSVATQLTVRTGRLRHETQRQQLALNELGNQMDRLTAASESQRAKWLADLRPSDEAARVLPDAELTGEELRDEHGRRLVLRLSWNQAMPTPPLLLTGWIEPAPESSDESPSTEITP